MRMKWRFSFNHFFSVFMWNRTGEHIHHLTPYTHTHSYLYMFSPKICQFFQYDKPVSCFLRYILSIDPENVISDISHHNSSWYDGRGGIILTPISITARVHELHIQTLWGCFLLYCPLFQFRWALQNKSFTSARVIVAACMVLITEHQLLFPGHDSEYFTTRFFIN